MKRASLVAALAVLMLTACQDAPDEAPPPAGESDAGAVADAPADTPVPPVRGLQTEPPPASGFAVVDDCAELPEQAAAICRRPVLSQSADPDLTVSAARFDIDGDGADDMILRRESVVDCGTHGCATFVLFARSGDFVIADPPINAHGPAAACVRDGVPGVRFAQAGPDAACIKVVPRS